jgi:molybdopterin-guanine dinucleotide biosynthesis protein A
MTGVILAGGSNRRYPILKGLIEFRGKRSIERVAESLKDLSRRLIITNNPEAYFYLGLPMYGDLFDFRCPLTGIYTALINSEEDILVAAVDMPLINPGLVSFISNEAKNRLKSYDAVIPVFDNKAQPLLGAYSRRLIPVLKEWIEKKRCRMTDFLKEIKTYYIPEMDIKALDPEGLSFININTPEDKIRAESLLSKTNL